jgi:rubredoxin
MSDEMPKIQCPNCGALHEDFDGLPLVHCTVCGWCMHPNSSIDNNGREICGICRRVIREANDD